MNETPNSPQPSSELTMCKAISKMQTDYKIWYVPQWDEVKEKVIFVESPHPKCVGLDITLPYYNCYELPADAEIMTLGYMIIW